MKRSAKSVRSTTFGSRWMMSLLPMKSTGIPKT
nr:MAG TPA: hypothetical protein [Caudoviricetes sp.]